MYKRKRFYINITIKVMTLRDDIRAPYRVLVIEYVYYAIQTQIDMYNVLYV